MSTDLTRPIIGIENRTAQEVFDIMCDRFRHSLTPSRSPETEGMVEALKPLEWVRDEVSDRWLATTIVGVYAAWGRNWRLGNGIVFQVESDTYSRQARDAAEADYHRIVYSALRALPQPTAGEGWQPTHQHRKGGKYVLIGIGKMQAEGWMATARAIPGKGGMPTVSGAPADMREVAIYRSVDDGSLWVRPREEFEDGRFTPLPAAPGVRL